MYFCFLLCFRDSHCRCSSLNASHTPSVSSRKLCCTILHLLQLALENCSWGITNRQAYAKTEHNNPLYAVSLTPWGHANFLTKNPINANNIVAGVPSQIIHNCYSKLSNVLHIFKCSSIRCIIYMKHGSFGFVST